MDDIVSRTWLRIGPLRIVPSFEFSNFGWVSNVYGQTGGEHAVSDFLITPSPKIGIYFLYGRRLMLSFTENPEYHIYLKLHRFNHFTNNYGAELSFPFLNSLVITGGFSSQSFRHIPLAELDRQVETGTKAVRTEVAYETTRRLSWILRGFAQQLSYGDILREEDGPDVLSQNLDREEIGGQFEVRYEAFRGSRLFLQLGYVQHHFLDETSVWKDADSRTYLAGIRFPSLGRLSGSLALGLKSFQPSDQGVTSFSGFIAQSQVGIKLGTDTSLTLGYNRDTAYSYWSNAMFYLSDSINATFTIGLSRFLDIHLGGNYARFHYQGSGENEAVPGSGPLPGRSDRYAGFSAGFTVPVWKNYRAGLTYQYWTRPSGFTGSGDGHLLTVNFLRE